MVIAGTQGCGKTTHAETLRQLFGCTHIVEEWDGRSPLEPGALALTDLSVAHVWSPERVSDQDVRSRVRESTDAEKAIVNLVHRDAKSEDDCRGWHAGEPDVEAIESVDDEAARSWIAARWRGDAATVLSFAGQLLAAGEAQTMDGAIRRARECWQRLLLDDQFGGSSIGLPGNSAVEALHRRLRRDPKAGPCSDSK